ncbi:hypothetical protein KEM56_000948 [Ascosphaera pollenicola]|nr:hypothetical protein KEM56_000948 [Ascosphaera pollenicola]
MEHPTHQNRRLPPSLQGLQLTPLHSIASGTEEGFDSPVYSNHTATNYLSSSTSVPNTPSVLSDTRTSFFSIPHANSSQNFGVHASATSDTNLRRLGEQSPARHGRPHHRRRSTAQPRASAFNDQIQQGQDSEWLLRAGSAFSTSARKDKGQSWLIKRQSSTSLHLDADDHQSQARQTSSAYQSRNASRARSRSRVSTPTNGRSRHGSRAAIDRRHLSMTPLHPTAQDECSEDAREMSDSRRTSVSVWSAFESENLDERGDDLTTTRHGAGPDVEHLSMQDLNRFRGFGLGNWLDKVVHSVIFGAEDEEPINAPHGQQKSGTSAHSYSSASKSTANESQDDNESNYTADGTIDESDSDDDHSVVLPFEEEDLRKTTSLQRPDQEGSYLSDITWLLHVAKSSLY